MATGQTAGEERKFVTVLFADVVGSTHLSSAVDPESLRAQMARFFTIAREEIERFGGTVEKFIGDAVMAVFGLPTLHEDDPERAARAAAAVEQRVHPLSETGDLPPIRIGLYTGEVVADPQAAAKGEFLVTGETVNLAARLQQHAEPGQILVGERTMRALQNVATLRAVPPLEVKGRTQPLPAWQLLEVPPPRPRELRATPFVGRQEELDLLGGHVRRMLRERRGHVVTLLGPAGVGKTRLVQEFRQRTGWVLEGQVHILQGRAIPYGTGVPFWSLAEAIREQCGILFGDPLESARHKLEAAAAALEVSAAVPALLTVLGLGGGGRDLTREELFAGMRGFFRALSDRAPLILTLEDFHSAEDVTLDFLEDAGDWIRDIPLLLVVLSRPELLERRRSWMGGKRSATTLFLDPLPGEDSRALAQAILGQRAAPEEVVALVLRRAEGNPLFMEEMLRVLVEGGILSKENGRWALTIPLGEVAIPDTVQAVIGARVDTLPLPEKQTLQGAAVQGKDFWLGPLRLVVQGNHIEDAVQALVDKELLIRKLRSTLVGEDEFTFRHILIRDVAYAMIPKSRRLLQHERMAEWTAQMAADRPAEWSDYIAHHWLQVVGLRQELGLPPDLRAQEEATTHLLLAGERAAGVYANTTALDHFTRALDLHPASPARLRAFHGRGEVWFLLGQYDQARADFDAVRALARELEQPRWEAIALDRTGFAYRQQDQYATALEYLERALAISRRLEDPVLTGQILNHIGFTIFAQDNHAESIRVHEEARHLLERANDAAGLAESLHGLGDNLAFLGRFEDAVKSYVESLALCERLGNRSLGGENRYMIAFARQKGGDYVTSQAEADRSVAVLGEIGDARNLSPALFVQANLAAIRGDFGRALTLAARGVDLASQIGAVRIHVYSLLIIGRVHRELEDYAGALATDEEALALGHQVRGVWLPVIRASLAADKAALGRWEEAETEITRARRALEETETRLDFAEEVAYLEGLSEILHGRPAEAHRIAEHLARLVEIGEAKHWRVPGLLIAGEAAAALGEHTDALGQFQEAAREAETTGRLPALWRALAGMTEVHKTQGRPGEASASAQKGREIIERIAASVPDERLRAVFLHSRRVQRVLALAGG
ncbi:MAG TPA: tetratricopeptide repeat protein [bacterium]|nr:tetratricopeptide repeat protein [bacterium]